MSVIRASQIILSTLILSFLFSCENDEPESPTIPIINDTLLIINDTLLVFNCVDSGNSNCLEKVLVNPDAYDSANSNLISDFNNLEIINDCLKVEYEASGCSGSTWILTLIDSGYLANTNPPIRKLRWDFYNPEACLSGFTKSKSFDLCPLKIPGQDSIMLQIEDSTLVYRY